MSDKDLNLHEDRYFSAIPEERKIARHLYDLVKDLPLVSPHGHVDPRLLAEPVTEAQFEPLTPVEAEEEPLGTAQAADVVDEEAEMLPAFGDVGFDEIKPEAPPKEERRRPLRFEESDDIEEADLEDEALGGKRSKKGKRKQRELIYDEERGEVVAKRRRKGSRRREEWEDYLD